ncbi:MAG: 2-phospho-L-lactate guanylyltransferase [Candidatus Dormiibacterota bacterium]
MTVDPWLVIPVKAPQGSKQRLAARVPEHQRRLLSSVMARRVVRTAAEVWPRGAMVVVTTDPELAALCRRLEVAVLQDPGSGQTAAVQSGVYHALERGAEVVATLAADLPRLTAEDLRALLAAARRTGPGTMVLIPDLSGTGSNGMVVRPGTILLHAFGPDSRRRHLDRARALGLRVRELRRTGLARDLDRPGDLLGLDGAEAALAVEPGDG